MSANTPTWTPRIVHFWPTVVMRRFLPEYRRHQPQLIALVNKLNQDTEQLTTAYQGADFLSNDTLGVKWLKQSIDESVSQYLTHQGIDYPVDWTLQAWANVNRYGDYHAPHNHGWCYLSGTYYLQMPESSPGVSNAISFYDPRGAINTSSLSSKDTNDTEQTFRPLEGTLMLWHSALQHLVHPNLTSHTRITISFNVVLTWQNHYVEQ